MKHPATRMLFSYWDALRGERAAPERGEIEPGEIRHILADTFVLELDAQREARFRLAGTRICGLMGGELRDGRLVDLWPERARHDMRKDLDIVLAEARRNGARMPVTALVDQFYADVQKMGGGRWDTSSLLARFERK